MIQKVSIAVGWLALAFIAYAKLVAALEAAGVEFLEGNGGGVGVRLRDL
jgi:hypothetical protein